MLKSVKISNVASFGETCQEFGDLGNVNFVYGSNGSGKTTISRVIATPENYQGKCALEWDGGIPLSAVVYNKDFVDANFAPSTEIKGVFTLGAADKVIVDAIATKRKQLDDLIQKIISLDSDLNGDSGKITLWAESEKAIEDYCWDKIRTPNDTDFKAVFRGLLNSKAKFKQQIVSLWTERKGKRSESVRTREGLVTEIKSIFGSDSARFSFLPTFDFSALSNGIGNQIFRQVIIGSGDVDIAKLINDIGISDWVREGHTHMNKSAGKCPFCQQMLPSDFTSKLDKYFDESFTHSMSDLKTWSNNIKIAIDSLSKWIVATEAIVNPYFDALAFKEIADRLVTKTVLISRLLESKQKEPSRVVEMPDIMPEVNQLNDIVFTTNKKIHEHNRLIDDKAANGRRIVDETWNLLIEEHWQNLETLFAKRDNCEKAKSGVEQAKIAKEHEKRVIEAELRELQKKQTSILPTVDAINSMLSSFGFDSFKLAPATETTYKLKRSDGSDVNDTLSEGERSFVTFLYFYHLLKGGVSSDRVEENRIAVIDDPVSSLDSNVLFVVASLVRQCVKDVQANNSALKQLIVLTHNVYFHKELTFSREHEKTKGISYWVVKKRNNNSFIKRETGNPIKTSYELLWKEIQDANSSLVSVQNAMRRILEFYFKILGGMNREDLESKFTGRDAFIVKSLFLWVNDGSHTIDDDLAYQVTEESIDTYKEVFARIFKELKHENHYNMMMCNGRDVNETHE